MSLSVPTERTEPAEPEPRRCCPRCRRPEVVCYCRFVEPLPTRTRVVLLQHPRERDMPIGTAHMASLCLPNSELHVGLHFRGRPEIDRALSDPERPAALLYPGEGALDVVSHPPSHPVTLVVVDGTWSQAKKVVRENPQLAALPRYSFTPPQPSEYRIRREPKESYVSTLEALVHVLEALEPEGDPARFRAMLLPFRAMVNTQIDFATRVHRQRKRRPRPAPERPRVPSALLDPGELICVVAEANAWPYRSAEREADYPDELVHWAALRLSTGEVFEAVLAPRHPLAERTCENLGLSPEELLGGESLPSFLGRWASFLRPGDRPCAWGDYASRMLSTVGGELPPGLDLRRVAKDWFKGSVGTPEELLQREGQAPLPSSARGRAGRRLGLLGALCEHLRGPREGEA